MVGKNPYGYLTPAFSGFPWWGEIRKEVDVVEISKNHVKRGGNG